jgi:predicted component of type VI protein secretion system
MPSVDSALAPPLESDNLRVVLEATTGASRPRRVLVEGGTCLIGRGEFCDLQLADVDAPIVHSEIHIERGILWIEAADAHEIEINGHSCRRLALREGDQLRVGKTAIQVRINPPEGLLANGLGEDLSQLTALELCERIEAEQAEVSEFERRRLLGWDALITQLEDIIAQEPAASVAQEARIEKVLAQLHEVSSLLADRTRELAAQESQFLESAGELQQTQDQMTRRLELVLQRFQESELRASA